MAGAPDRTDPRLAALNRGDAWFSDGRLLKAAARHARKCVECRVDLPNRRTPYCSSGCRRRFHARFFWDSARSCILRRDRYRCQSCGERRRARQLDVDHIRELADGGAALSFENLRTLCRECHRRKTAESSRRRAAARRDDSQADGSDWFPA